MKILAIYQSGLGFRPDLQNDVKALKQVYEVRELPFRRIIDIYALWLSVNWCDVVFSYFGKLPALYSILFCKILGKKIVIHAGGDDVANVPEIKYGMFYNWWKKWCPLLIFRYADLTLAVSDYNMCEAIENAKINPLKIKRIYHGIDSKRFFRIPDIPKGNIVLTVGNINFETISKKGLALFVRSATLIPEIPFFLVGPGDPRAIEWLENIIPSNVTLTGPLYGKDLVLMYNKAKVYVQVSIHESFGCSVAEAMLCECIPVVSQKAALPEVVGDCGFYVDDDLTPQSVANKIKEALASDLGYKARTRIIQGFPLENRREALLAAVDKVMN